MSWTTADITPQNWPGSNLVGSGCNGGGHCPGGFTGVSQTVSSGCGTYDCNCNFMFCQQCQANKTECGVDPSAAGAKTKMCPSIPGLSVSSYRYTQGIGGSYGSSSTNVKIKCVYYGTPQDPFSQTVLNNFSGTPALLSMQNSYCMSLDYADLMTNKTNCTSALRSSADASDSTLGYDTQLVNLCIADTSYAWIDNPDIVTYLKSVVRNGHDTQGHVATLFNTYCRGDPLNSKATGPNRTKAICSCINISDFGYLGTSNCFDAPMNTYPGCADFSDQANGQTFLGLVKRIGPIISMPENPEKSSAISVMGNDPKCLAGACSWAEHSDNTYLATDAKTCPAMAVQICSQNVTIGVAQDSPIDTSCHQEQTVTVTTNYGNSPGSAPPVTTTGSSPSPRSSTSPLPAPSPSDSLPFPFLKGFLNTATKQWAGIGGCICIICMCFLAIIFLSMSGGDENSGGSIGAIAALLAANRSRQR
jgi:hypothetical protein